MFPSLAFRSLSLSTTMGFGDVLWTRIRTKKPNLLAFLLFFLLFRKWIYREMEINRYTLPLASVPEKPSVDEKHVLFFSAKSRVCSNKSACGPQKPFIQNGPVSPWPRVDQNLKRYRVSPLWHLFQRCESFRCLVVGLVVSRGETDSAF